MASLREYFTKDGSSNLTEHQPWTISVDGSAVYEVIARIHYDFECGGKYISFYVPAIEGVDCIEEYLLGQLDKILAWQQTSSASMGFVGHQVSTRDLRFTGFVYFYSEKMPSDKCRSQTLENAAKINIQVIFRSEDYVKERSKWEKPLAFISHDSRDKKTIAEPLAIKLAQLMCPVWYDEFSMQVGDSLRESIEKGIRDCHRCVLILTPNFLANGGWSKKEYDSIFTRELIEKKKVILPVWHGVTQKDVYEYSPALADKVATQWSSGIDEVARKLLSAISIPV